MDDREFHSVIAHLRVAGTDNQSFEVKSCRKELTRDIGRTARYRKNHLGLRERFRRHHHLRARRE